MLKEHRCDESERRGSLLKRMGYTRDRLALTWVDGGRALNQDSFPDQLDKFEILKQHLECRGQGLQQMIG
jgi:hypothetical protein